MKFVLYTVLFFLLSSNVFAQSLKKGIYLSFEEIRNNKPIQTDSLNITVRTKSQVIMVGGGNYGFELIPENKRVYKEIKRSFVGISDGEKFYISDRLTVGGWQGMTLCVLSGPYMIAPIHGSAGAYSGGGVIPGMIKVGNGFLINIKDGTSVNLSKKTLMAIMKNYPDILKEYESKPDLMNFAVEIIGKINDLENMKGVR